MDNKEDILLGSLMQDIDLCRSVISYIKPDYFPSKPSKTLFKVIYDYFIKYDKIITRDILLVELTKVKWLTDDMYNEVVSLFEKLSQRNNEVDKEWFIDFAETYCKEMAVYNAVQESIILLEEDKNIDQLPHIFEKAVGVTFDTSVGHDYQKDALDRFKKYSEKADKIPTGWKELDKATDGGFERKKIHIIMGGSGVGKSLTMVSMASNMIRNGYNVLYISMELSEEDIGQRFDANLLSVDIDRLGDLSADSFTSKVNMLMGRSHGQLVIKEYPTGGANVNHFKALLSELKQKTGFTPDVVYIDYVNICSSSLMPKANGTYSVVKSITEELRGLAVQENLCLVTATQTGRGVQETSDIALSDVSESYGLVQTADYILGIIQTEELAKQNKYYVKQLKSRYGDINRRPFWFFGVNKLKMTIYDIESTDYAINETVENIQKINSDRSALHSNQPPLKSRLKF